jgi:hypothetical protein
LHPLSLSAELFRTFDLLRDHGISHSSCHPHCGPILCALTLSFCLLLASARDSPYTSILPSFALLTPHSLLWFTSHAPSIIHCQAVDLLLLCPFGVLVFLRAICFFHIHSLVRNQCYWVIYHCLCRFHVCGVRSASSGSIIYFRGRARSKRGKL